MAENRETISTCTICGYVAEVRPYGEGDSLICLPCATRVNPPAVIEAIDEEFRKELEAIHKHQETLRAFAACFGEFTDPKNPTSTAIH